MSPTWFHQHSYPYWGVLQPRDVIDSVIITLTFILCK